MDYVIESKDRREARWISSDKTLEEVKKENPGKIVTRHKKSFPYISTTFLLIALSLIVYSCLVKGKEKKIIKLWEFIETNKKVKADKLKTQFGIDDAFIHEALFAINRTGASYAYHADSDLIYEDKSTLEWHLVKKCDNCAGAIDQKVFIALDTEFFVCPYCSSHIQDPKFDAFREKQERKAEEVEEQRAVKQKAAVAEFFNVKPPQIFNPPADLDAFLQEVDISWSPLRGGGSSFTTKKMVPLSDQRIAFKTTIIPYLACLLGIFISVSVLAAGFRAEMGSEKFWAHIIFGLIVLIAVILVFRYMTTPIIFDLERGYFWKSRKMPHSDSEAINMKNAGRIEDIHALQIVDEYVRSNSSSGSRSYHSYELNVIMKDSSRINLFDHGGYNRAQQDAKVLAEKLNIPLLTRE